MIEFSFTATVLTIQSEKGGGVWHYVLLPEDMRVEVAEWIAGMTAGWGSKRVRATIGETTWQTSIFPSKANRTYLLPLKADVRKAERISEGMEVEVALAL